MQLYFSSKFLLFELPENRKVIEKTYIYISINFTIFYQMKYQILGLGSQSTLSLKKNQAIFIP